MDNVVFFKTQSEFTQWLEKNHKNSQEVWLGYFKKHTGKESMSWGESVDCALMFGWIDGIRNTIDDDHYKIRFTKRKTNSVWSKVNVDKVQKLITGNLMRPEGLRVFEQRKDRVGYSASSKEDTLLSEAYEKVLESHNDAWTFYKQLPFAYKRDSIYWIMSAKKEETQLNRFNRLISSWEKNEMFKF